MELSLKDRLILANQYRILQMLHEAKSEKEEADGYALWVEMLDRGYSGEYSELTTWMQKEPLTKEECSEVKDVLDMYEMMHRAYGDLDDKGSLKEEDVTFPGFDGSNESSRMGYCTHLYKAEKYQHVITPQRLNTHTRMMERYRRMLLVWEPATKKAYLTKEDMEQIITAKNRPD